LRENVGEPLHYLETISQNLLSASAWPTMLGTKGTARQSQAGPNSSKAHPEGPL